MNVLNQWKTNTSKSTFKKKKKIDGSQENLMLKMIYEMKNILGVMDWLQKIIDRFECIARDICEVSKPDWNYNVITGVMMRSHES